MRSPQVRHADARSRVGAKAGDELVDSKGWNPTFRKSRNVGHPAPGCMGLDNTPCNEQNSTLVFGPRVLMVVHGTGIFGAAA